MINKLTFVLSFVVLLGSCNNEPKKEQETGKKIESESKKANDFFELAFKEWLALHPERSSILGVKDNQDKWDDISDSFYAQELIFFETKKAHLIKEIDSHFLDKQTKVSYQLYIKECDEYIKMYPFRYFNYPINQEEGLHADAPSFLMNIHSIENEKDAQDYIARLKAINPLFQELVKGLKKREDMGIIAPDFTFPKVIGSCNNILKGFPFENTKDSADILKDFAGKVRKAKLQNGDKLIQEAVMVLNKDFYSGYIYLLDYLKILQKKAPKEAGCWKWDIDGKYYQAALEHHTSTKLTPNEIYDLGIKEVERIHKEIKAIMKQVNFKSDNLQEFLQFVTTDKQFFYPDTEEGRNRYLKEAEQYIEGMNARLDEIFITKPKAKLVVKRVEPFREKSTGGAFYDEPAPDGSRPGRFYANLSDMSIMPVYQLEALAYHEGNPGHHMQIAISQELQGIPRFRKFKGHTAYNEGWGLYTERLGKEMGFYKDPYQDFGRLSMELLRAARLVVDPAIHAKKWTREEAISYFEKNTAEPKGECIKAIERYCIWPGQATAYKIGMIKIQELREKAKSELKDKFSLRAFHDVILTSASLPLDVLESIVDKWIEDSKNEK